MKRLCLLRHAEALPAVPGVMDDKGRVLSAQGKKEALAAGVFLNEKFRPDYALCSTAQRTRQTLDGVMKAMEPFQNAPPSSAPSTASCPRR